MRALSLYQPWATLIAEGFKSTETRPKRAPKNADGEVIAIHASKTQDDEFRYNDPDVVNLLGLEPLPSGAIVAIARLKDCIPTENCLTTPQEEHFGNFAPGRWAWRFEDVQPLTEPVPCRGQPIVWEIGPELTAVVMERTGPPTILTPHTSPARTRPAEQNP